VFARYPSRSGSLIEALWHSNAAGKRITRIPLGLGRVWLAGYDWSPGGGRLVFAASRDAAPPEGPMMYTISVDGTHRRPLHRGWNPSWSDDGRYIVFTSLVYGGLRPDDDKHEISVIRPDGTGYRRLTTSSRDSSPSFSPDGSRVVFVRQPVGLAGDEWRAIDVTGHNETLLATHLWASRFRYCPPRWEPDGKRLAAVRTHSGPTGNDPSTAAFVTVTSTGTDERVAFDFPIHYVAGYVCDFSWQPIP
jgi:hypothetical protein